MGDKKLYNSDYESCLLGCMVLDNSCIDTVQSRIKPEYFFIESYRGIYNSICEIYNGHHAVDLVSLTGECTSVKTDIIAGVTDKVTSSSNIEFYITEISNLFMARSVYSLCYETLGNLSSRNINDVLSSIDNKITGCIGGVSSTVKQNSQDMVNAFIAEIEESKKNKQNVYLGYETGIAQLDDMLDGLPKGNLIILGARPSIGKSAIAIQLLFNLSERKTPCAIFSLEMSNMSLMYRRVASETGIKTYFLKHGLALNSQQAMVKLQSCMEKIYGTNIDFFDTANGSRNINWILTTIRALAKKGTKVFFIDHIGLIKYSDESKKRYEQLADITERLHDLAMTLGITIVCLCQLRRDAEGKKPVLSDLRESGDIEQNADVVMFLHRARAQGNEVSIPSELIVVKNRDGACGTINMDFYPSTTKFAEAKKENIMKPEIKKTDDKMPF